MSTKPEAIRLIEQRPAIGEWKALDRWSTKACDELRRLAAVESAYTAPQPIPLPPMTPAELLEIIGARDLLPLTETLCRKVEAAMVARCGRVQGSVPVAQPLTDERILSILQSTNPIVDLNADEDSALEAIVLAACRAIERAHGITGGAA